MKILLLILDVLFKGGAWVCGLKCGGYFFAGVLACAINERGESDGVFRTASVVLLLIGVALAIFSIVWSLIRETRDEKLVKKWLQSR